MHQHFDRLRLVALNIDGVLLNDTFSPVIGNFITSRGGGYDAGTERRILSQPRRVAGGEMARAAGLDITGDEALELYFAERDRYVAEHPVRPNPGAADLIERVRGLGLQVVCYGGLSKPHFDTHLGPWAHLFDGPGYVCTDSFRPGIREIAEDVFSLGLDEVLFVDDVARVAETAKGLGVPFIGHPCSFQRTFMEELSVRHIVGSLDAIDEELIRTLDAEAAAGTVWPANVAL
ncbi:MULTISPECIES: HAD family phosphatase [unclassified Streptomyces]|uniref:HAD family hydrolase n=1 Tax=unclassified Streptomyces TaxID=2593676 RepID=UPI001367CB71|nr:MULTISPECIES: HAD family phosphatase [unclassified Streptomyces]NEA03271.1 HAD family phosphatase [Streptomyces sp. SID10116]MYY85556.1 HAD family phosphatase [Streptomyces sp. SID335]MYZ15153.1 HAD family phosphatase [Streptomyces sp. SID337]NDZ90456.1 HAD family phosphatase [Streptomyces sp. SID10115]NEB49557.1 HAD family phosphatase [Streptomyces sp. SID339]